MFSFEVKGQKGSIPSWGFGTATVADCKNSVRAAIQCGYRHIDTALLYNNQEDVGLAIKESIEAGEVKREDLFITTKVGFYPEACVGGKNGDEGVSKNSNTFIRFHRENRKGYEITNEAIDLCLKKLGLDYVDLLLIHNPCTELDDFRASSGPHAFELSNNTHLDQDERELLLSRRLNLVKFDEEKAERIRAATWKALEEAQKNGKTKYIGVSNYPTRLVKNMEKYALVMPCVNQLEFHPRASSPSLQALAKELGLVLTAYGSCNSTSIEKREETRSHSVVSAIAAKYNLSTYSVILKWTLAKGVVVIPRSAKASHLKENKDACTDGIKLTDDDIKQLDTLNEAHFYYWSPMPLLAPGSPQDL